MAEFAAPELLLFAPGPRPVPPFLAYQVAMGSPPERFVRVLWIEKRGASFGLHTVMWSLRRRRT